METLGPHLLKNYRTTVAPGKYFGLGDHFRIGIGGTPALFSKGLENLEAALDTLPAD